jgi:membrane-bound lytic murein transglycosylase F
LNPLAHGPAGDSGIMQLIPVTAREMGVSSVFDPEANIAGGIKLDAANWRYWASIPDTAERRKIAFASYNAGPGNISRARARAGGAITWAAISAHLAEVTGRWADTTIRYVNNIHRVYAEISK